jgi:hypothetical protein
MFQFSIMSGNSYFHRASVISSSSLMICPFQEEGRSKKHVHEQRKTQMNLQTMYIDPMKAAFRLQAARTISQFEKRGIHGAYFENSKEAVAAFANMIPENSTVALGGSVSIIQAGLLDALRAMNIQLLDRYREGLTREEADEQRKLGMTADVFIASSNAVTLDGKIVSEDGFGTRVARMINGPGRVILLVGMNKLVPSVASAMERIKHIAAPMNCLRLGKSTPCAATGVCDDGNCFPPERICSQIVVIEANSVPDRMNVVLVGEDLGF